MMWRPRNFVALLIATMACWTERQAAAQLDNLKVENRALRSRLGRGRIFFTDAERRTLGALTKKASDTCSPAPSRTYGMTLSVNF
jgi:hypothetical protein